MATTKEKRLVFLEDTIKYYSEDVTRRAVHGEACEYRLVCEDGTVKKCAVGRHIPDKNYNECFEGKNVLNYNIYESLPKKIQSLGMTFLYEVQQLHDHNSNWSETGLTVKGEKERDLIKHHIEINNFS